MLSQDWKQLPLPCLGLKVKSNLESKSLERPSSWLANRETNPRPPVSSRGSQVALRAKGVGFCMSLGRVGSVAAARPDGEALWEETFMGSHVVRETMQNNSAPRSLWLDVLERRSAPSNCGEPLCRMRISSLHSFRRRHKLFK